MKQCLMASAFGVCVMAGSGWADVEAPAVRELREHIPAAGVSDLKEQVTRAATAGARYLLGLPSEDPKGNLFVPPHRAGVPTEIVEEERRFRRVTRTVPVYEYEHYTVMERDGYGELKPVVRQRPVKQIGTREEEYLTSDPAGDVVQIHRYIAKRKADEFQGPDVYVDGVLGQNGLVLYALLSAGVPADREPIPAVVADLLDFCERYGLPDRTWDLVWLGAGLCRLPDGDEKADQLRTRIANKLLLGQIESGPGKGLWGPYAVNPALVAAMVDYERKAHLDGITKLTQEVRRDPDDKVKSRRLEELKKKQSDFARQYNDYDLTMRNHRAHAPLRYPHVDIRPNPEDEEHWIRVFSTPYHAMGERLGDLESTRAALFALRLLGKRGNLPTSTLMPKDDKGAALLAPLRSSIVVEQGLKAAAGCLRSDGFHEGNVMQSFAYFDKLGSVGLPINPNELPVLASKVTLPSMVDGYAALKGGSGFSGVRTPSVRLGAVASYLEKELPSILNMKARPNSKEYIDSFSILLALTGVELPAASVNQQVVRYVLDRQDPTNGYWSVKSDRRYRQQASSSLRAFFDQSLNRWHACWMEMDPEKFRDFSENERKRARGAYDQIFARDMMLEAYCTAAALVFLSDALQSPAAGFWQRGESSVPAGRVLGRVLEEINKGRRRSEAYEGVVFEADLSGLSADVPVLVTGGQGAFSLDDETMRRFGDYLAGEGLAVGIADAGAEGVLFTDALESAVLNALPGSAKKRFSVAGGRAEVDAVVREDGSVAAVLLVAGNAPDAASSRPIMPVAGMMSTVLEIMRLRIGPERIADAPLVDLSRLDASATE